MHYIWNTWLSQELRAVLTSLLMHVHIDNKPRTERNVPIYTKKLIFSENKPKDKVKNNAEVNDFFRKEQAKKHDAVVDISKLSSYTKTVQQNKKEMNIFGDQPFEKLEEINEEFSENRSSYANEIEKEIIDEFVKEDDQSIKDEDLKNLKDKILYYLENEVVLKSIVAKPEEKNYEVNFNHLLLNMVELVRKLVLFECFAPEEKTKKPLKKIMIFGKKEQIVQNDFSHLVRALIDILRSEHVENCEKNKIPKELILEKNDVKNNEKEDKKEILPLKGVSKKKRKVSFTNIENKGGSSFLNLFD